MDYLKFKTVSSNVFFYLEWYIRDQFVYLSKDDFDTYIFMPKLQSLQPLTILW